MKEKLRKNEQTVIKYCSIIFLEMESLSNYQQYFFTYLQQYWMNILKAITFQFSKAILRKHFQKIRTNQIAQNGSILYSGFKKNLQTIIKTSKQIQTIGSYIYSTNMQIIPPTIQRYQSAFPYFQPKLNNSKPPLLEFKLHGPGLKYSERIYGIKIPNKSHQTIFPQLVLVPLICFNPQSKHRIGYGGGYYDEYIRHCRQNQIKAIFIGIGFECLKQVSNFSSQNDQSLDYIITQRQIY